LTQRLEIVRERIVRAGGDLDRITIVAVTKTFGVETVRAALEAGLENVGENYAQEAAEKAKDLATNDGGSGPTWHFIGQVQRNKVKVLAPIVDVWQTVDSARLAQEIAKRQPGATVLLQLNATDDPARGGCSWSDLDAVHDAAASSGLVVRGLMGVGPPGDPEDSRPFFRKVCKEAQRRELSEVSTGMSNDFEVAVDEGATMLRLGSVLFGSRDGRP